MARLRVTLPSMNAAIQATPTSLPAAIMGAMTTQLSPKSDFAYGEISGLPAEPTYCTAQTIIETGVSVQSGIAYSFTPTKFTDDGFQWKIAVTGNEYWPGPGPVTLLINYVWGTQT
jgi:hypothetical protein